MAWPLPDMIGKLRDFSREAGRIEPAARLDLQTDQSSQFQGEKTMTATAAQPQGRPWWLTLIMGIAAVVIGGILIFGSLTAQTRLYLLLIQLVGIWWLIDGITTIIYMFVDRSAWGWKLAAGIVGMLAGGWILIYPVYAAVALPRIFLLIIGIWGVVYGGQLLFASLRTRAWASVALGAITVVLGLILIANADEAGWGLSLITMAAWFAFLGGFVVIYRALRERKA
jgi:uncharacterized membrane protein HdeD (DUF308 family)